MSLKNDNTEETEHDDDEPNEMSTAVSYYRFFQALNESQSRRQHTSNSDDNSHWQEDEWTEQDTLEVERILLEAQERCNVQQHSHHHVPPSSNWDTFYKHHQTNFFKDRNYLSQDLINMGGGVLVEIGCGVGNALLPLLQQQEWKEVWGLDFSPVAIDLLQKQERFIQNQDRARTHVWDISKPIVPNDELPWFGVADVTTLLFCLSALNPSTFQTAAMNVAATLKPGGELLFRDYGRYDEAQLKLGTSRGKRLGENFYRKHDGTTVYYFTIEELQKLFQDAGLQVLEVKYIRRIYTNHKTKERRRRVWIQGKFIKPIQA